jgi:hypothetical protein
MQLVFDEIRFDCTKTVVLCKKLYHGKYEIDLKVVRSRKVLNRMIRIRLISTALLLDSIIRNSVCTPAKLPCRRVEVGYEIKSGVTQMGRHFY